MERALGVDPTIATHPYETFEEFFEAERPRLFATLTLILSDRGLAEDLTQESFVRVLERWDRVRTHPDPPGYLYRTALNLVRQRRRRALRRPREPMVAPDADTFATVDDRQDVLAVLRRLAPRQRAALVLTELLDMDAREAARILSVRPATVRSLASQARSAFRTIGGNPDAR